MNRLKRVAAINDISGFGKCSLTVALPIISAAGCECACIPTALLSTHTGVFTGWTFKDLSQETLPIARHWSELGVEFDAVYSGYMASPGQIDSLGEVIALLSKSNPVYVIIDPVMADGGRYYSNLGRQHCEAFKRLIRAADIVTPNITEACFLTDSQYLKPPYTSEYISQLLERLSRLGAKNAVLTGVSLRPGFTGSACLDAGGKTHFCENKTVDGVYHGGGDVFASALCGCVLRGLSLAAAIDVATEFVGACVARTHARGTPPHYGLDFESGLAAFMRKIEEAL